MSPAELRQRLVRIAAEAPDALLPDALASDRLIPDPSAPDPLAVHGDDLPLPPHHALVPAAVLVPVVFGQSPGIILTKRTSHLTKHAGQVSFPGGRIDPDDASPEAAALREAQEEIGLDPASVEVLGRMKDYITGTGYRITPVLALVPSGVLYRLSPHEVESVFELPMSVVLDPDAPRRQRQHVGGRWREYWVWPHPDHYIWGATAAILVHLAERLRKGRD